MKYIGMPDVPVKTGKREVIMISAPNGYRTEIAVNQECHGCSFYDADDSGCDKCPRTTGNNRLLCVQLAEDYDCADSGLIFVREEEIPEKLDMHLLQHKKLLMALDELVNDFEAHNGGMPTLLKLTDWAEKQARATDHMSLHPGV